MENAARTAGPVFMQLNWRWDGRANARHSRGPSLTDEGPSWDALARPLHNVLVFFDAPFLP